MGEIKRVPGGKFRYKAVCYESDRFYVGMEWSIDRWVIGWRCDHHHECDRYRILYIYIGPVCIGGGIRKQPPTRSEYGLQ